MKPHPRFIDDAAARKMAVTYRRVKSLTVTAERHGRSVCGVHRALIRLGVIQPRHTPRLADDLVKRMHADYEGGLTLSALSRKWDRSRRNLAEIFKRRGLALRPCEIVMNLSPATGQMLPKRRLTAAEITAALEVMTKMKIPRELWLEWRKWSLAERREFIERARARLQPEHGRPRGAFSANVTPFDYATPEAQRISAALNAGCTSRNKRVQLRFGSEGVIYRGKLWFWTKKTGYLYGRWSAVAPRVMLHQVIWQEANGRALPAGHVVRFADGNHNNFDPANLVLATRSDLARENQAGALLRRARAVTGLLLSQTRQPKSTDENRLALTRLARR